MTSLSRELRTARTRERGRKSAALALGAGLVALGMPAWVFAQTSHPAGHLRTARPSKTVIIFEENKSFNQIIGNDSAPYINQLAQEGMLFTSFYAITHPSQPNYLEFFSGSNQGIVNNANPAPGTPFSTPNLASSLMDAGFSFIGYAEDLPWVGATVPTWNWYTRLTNPWVNWQVDGTPQPNQIQPTQNLPFSYFPTDFSQLPDVSIVIPNLLNNMHDGTIAQGDQWLANNLGPFVEWSRTNNGLLIFTFDEDESQSRNLIPTIFHGPMIRPGHNDATWTLHNLLRTVQDLYSAAHSGIAQRVRPMTGFSALSGEAVLPLRFRDGVGGYSGTQDTYIEADNPDASHGNNTSVWVIGSPLRQGLIRFDNIVGVGTGQVPPQATILSAKLSVLTGVASSEDRSFDTNSIHRMLVPWNESSTWESLGAGVSVDNVEAAAQPEFWLLPNVGVAWAIFDVTDTVQDWVNDPSSNYGWVIRGSGSDTWRWRSSEWGTINDRPVLEVVIATPPAPGPFQLVAPASGAVNQPTTPLLSWTAAAAATSYTVVIATDAALASPIHNQPGVTDTSYQLPDGVLDVCGVYYWGITAVNAYGASASSPLARSFSTRYPADFNGDGFVDGIDYDNFNNAFEAADPSADYNQDGFVDGIDYDDFHNAFALGC